MNIVSRPIYTIQEMPTGEWRLTKGPLSYVFPSEAHAIDGMKRLINNNIKGYDKDGNEIE